MRSHNGLPTIEHQDFGPQIDRATRVLNDANIGYIPLIRAASCTNSNLGWGLNLPGLDTMTLIAGKTGGRAIYAANDLAEAIRTVDRDTEVTYGLLSRAKS